ncbi:MAG: hypothetical protein HN341_16545 [Verrucomicrobia bacterium]|jgi:hypothetical protein|nr:hypothetical protein [Verrucomicrobiota bacterium]
MLTKTWSSAIQGVDAYAVEVEVNATGAGNENVTTVVGLPDTAVRESRERVWSALYTSGFIPPQGRTTVNLAPANLPPLGVPDMYCVTSRGLSLQPCRREPSTAGETSVALLQEVQALPVGGGHEGQPAWGGRVLSGFLPLPFGFSHGMLQGSPHL